MPEGGYTVTEKYEEFFKTAGGDRVAAAILTLASVIAESPHVAVTLSKDPDSDPIPIQANVHVSKTVHEAPRGTFSRSAIAAPLGS